MPRDTRQSLITAPSPLMFIRPSAVPFVLLSSLAHLRKHRCEEVHWPITLFSHLYFWYQNEKENIRKQNTNTLYKLYFHSLRDSVRFYLVTEKLKWKRKQVRKERNKGIARVGKMIKEVAGWREGGLRLSCQAAVNLRDRDVEAADFFCTSPLICTSDYLNWLEQS